MRRSAVFLVLVTGVILAGLVLLFIGYGDIPDTGDRPAREYEGGKLYRAGSMGVLQLSGSYEEMGRQYGGLLADEIQDFYRLAIDEHYIRNEGLDYGEIRDFSLAAYQRYPAKYQALMTGMSQTSGLPLEKVAILEQILSIQFVKAEVGECSALAAWGNYTGGGPLLLGRNYDSTPDFREFSPFLNVVVYNPSDDVPAAFVCYPGEVTSFTGMNAKGLFFEVNEGVKSGGSTIASDRLILPVELAGFLMEYPDFLSFDAAMNTTRSNYAFIVQVADNEAAYSYEASVADTRRRAGQEPGLLVATNDFVDPSWGLVPPVTAADKSVQRRENLLALADTYKGRITPATMMAIMDTSFADGGATWPDRTAYQVVAEPAENTMWVKTPGVQDWVEIDLDRYFVKT